jgi:hypothetical protein
MADFVPDDFEVPTSLEAPGFRLEPLGPEHNERDHAAWMSSIDHIHATPGFPMQDGWPHPMDLAANLGDLDQHRRDFEARTGFTYTVLDGDEVMGCVYLYPSDEDGVDAQVSSWVRASHAHLDEALWQTVNDWLARDWPFEVVRDHPRG